MQLLNTFEAARYLRLHRATLARWRVEGRGPRYRKHGTRIYYRKSDLDLWSETQARESTSDPGPEAVPEVNRRGLREVASGASVRRAASVRHTRRAQGDAD